MELDKYKILECLRVYAAILEMSIDKDISLYEAFSRYLMNNDTSLTIDDYDVMMIVKSFYSTSMLLFYFKDTFEKGLEGVSLDEASHFLDTSSDINKKCFENFTERDIVTYIRNALAHSKNDIYKMHIDGDNSKLKIKLNNTIASKGSNQGTNVPFEVELGIANLLMVSAFCTHRSKLINISGVDFDSEPVKNYKTGNVLDLLKKTIYTTYYKYDLFNQMKIQDRNKVIKAHIEGNVDKNFDDYHAEKAKFIRKTERINLDVLQKKVIYNALKEKANAVLSLNRLKYITDKNTDMANVKSITGVIMEEFFEYEALKTIPLGREKNNLHLVSLLINGSTNKNQVFSKKQKSILDSLYKGDEVYKIMNMFVELDEEERNMFIQTVYDTNYLKQEALVNYYNYVFENFIDENEQVTIGNKTYNSDRIRNSFTHGRWFPDNSGYWVMYDNKDSLKKPDHYRFDWKEAISFKAMSKFITKKYSEIIAENENIIENENHISK